jgi:sugar/nucleoside kinase (ribokinase family)
MKGNVDEVLDFLSRPIKSFNVVVMPDFFLDRIVSLESDLEDLFSSAGEVIQRGGGSLDQISQRDQRGGNAVNVTSALLALGVNVTPIVCTSDFGLSQVRFHLKEFELNTDHIKIRPKASITTALEFKKQEGKVNVMLRDIGSLSDFGPADFTENDWELLESADYVCVFNWAGTRKYGTQLAQTVFKHTKTSGKGKTFFDSADPFPNKEEISQLLEIVLKSKHLDILSLNENEAVTYASMISDKISKQKGKIELNELALLSARVLAKHLIARIDLHTTTFSATITERGAVFVPVFKVNSLRATGAGDAWDAGNLIGDAVGLSDAGRLTLANAVAAYYLTNKEGRHPSRKKLTDFLKKKGSFENPT